MIEVRGRVVDPDGQPVAGATVRTAYLDREIKPAPEVDQRAGRAVCHAGAAVAAQLRAAAPRCHVSLGRRLGTRLRAGLGLGRRAKPAHSGEVAIRLVADGPPIEGRIVDLEGRPIAGVAVRVERVWFDQRRQTVGLAGSGRWMAGSEGPWQGLEQFADDDHGHDRRRWSIPPRRGSAATGWPS